MIWVTEPTSPRGETTTAPWQRTPATPAGTLTVPLPNNAGTTQHTVSASGRILPGVLVFSIYHYKRLFYITNNYYVSPMKWGDIVFKLRCLSVRPSVRLSVRHTFVSALYLLNPWWDLQKTLHKCQV